MFDSPWQVLRFEIMMLEICLKSMKDITNMDFFLLGLEIGGWIIDDFPVLSLGFLLTLLTSAQKWQNPTNRRQQMGPDSKSQKEPKTRAKSRFQNTFIWREIWVTLYFSRWRYKAAAPTIEGIIITWMNWLIIYRTWVVC